MAPSTEKTPNRLVSVLTNKCPHCRKGDLFTDSNPYHLHSTMRMPERCPVCGQDFELQTGFYFGTGYVSYALSILIIGMGFAIWAIAFGLSVRDNSIFWCLGANIAILLLLQPVLQRLSRSIWISLFVKYEPAGSY